MMPDPSQVIVSTEPSTAFSVQTTCAHHRDLPELHVEGSSPEDAVARLAEQLSLALEGAPSHWRRETIERAIEDAKACASLCH